MRYPIYSPFLGESETENVTECLRSGWISSRGKFVGQFEDEFCAFTGAAAATSVFNGTVALHLALAVLDLPPGSEVIVPTFTYVASVNMIRHAGLVPVFVDSLPDTWQMNPQDVARKIGPRTSAIMAVHLYGHPCDLDALVSLASSHNLRLVEDCAEAFGTLWKGRHVGTFGDVGTFSFFGNKTITTGEGGMLIFRDTTVRDRAAHLKAQAVSADLRYWHDELGFNYRMTNIQAAIGSAQLGRARSILEKKRQIANWYSAELSETSLSVLGEIGDVSNSYWMVSAILPPDEDRDRVMAALEELGIETRPAFYPVHSMPMYKNALVHEEFAVANYLGRHGINLPSYPALERKDICHIVAAVSKVVGGA